MDGQTQQAAVVALLTDHLSGWALVTDEVNQLLRLIRRVEHELDKLTTDDQARIREAVDVVRSARQTVFLGILPSIRTQPEDAA